MLSTSLLIVAFRNLLTMGTDVDNAYLIKRSVQARKDRNQNGTMLSSNILRAACASFKGNVEDCDYYKSFLFGDFRIFMKSYNFHKALSMDNYTHINVRSHLLAQLIGRWDNRSSMEANEEEKYNISRG